MPNMADITVKKADGTTNITFTAVNPSGGDRSVALWRSNSVATYAAGKPSLQCSSKSSANGQQRLVNWKLIYPYSVTDTNGITRVQSQMIASATITVPTIMPDTVVAEVAAEFGNLLASSLANSVNNTGFAPN